MIQLVNFAFEEAKVEQVRSLEPTKAMESKVAVSGSALPMLPSDIRLRLDFQQLSSFEQRAALQFEPMVCVTPGHPIHGYGDYMSGTQRMVAEDSRATRDRHLKGALRRVTGVRCAGFFARLKRAKILAYAIALCRAP